MASKDNLLHFLRNNELGVVKKVNKKKIYSYIYPNKIYSNVKIPDCFFKKFTTDGKFLIGITQNLQEIKVYKYLGLGKDGCTPDNIFDKFFKLVYSKKIDNSKYFSKHFCLVTEDCKSLIVAAVNKQRENRICINKCLNNITFIMFDIQTGKTLDKYTFKNDYICLVNHSGVHLQKNLIAFISIHYQEITILKITDERKFKFYKKIGKYIHDDDEDYLKQFKHLNEDTENNLNFTKKKRKINIDNNFVRIVEPLNNESPTSSSTTSTNNSETYIPTSFITAAELDTYNNQQRLNDTVTTINTTTTNTTTATTTATATTASNNNNDNNHSQRIHQDNTNQQRDLDDSSSSLINISQTNLNNQLTNNVDSIHQRITHLNDLISRNSNNNDGNSNINNSNINNSNNNNNTNNRNYNVNNNNDNNSRNLPEINEETSSSTIRNSSNNSTSSFHTLPRRLLRRSRTNNNLRSLLQNRESLREALNRNSMMLKMK